MSGRKNKTGCAGVWGEKRSQTPNKTCGTAGDLISDGRLLDKDDKIKWMTNNYGNKETKVLQDFRRESTKTYPNTDACNYESELICFCQHEPGAFAGREDFFLLLLLPNVPFKSLYRQELKRVGAGVSLLLRVLSSRGWRKLIEEDVKSSNVGPPERSERPGTSKKTVQVWSNANRKKTAEEEKWHNDVHSRASSVWFSGNAGKKSCLSHRSMLKSSDPNCFQPVRWYNWTNQLPLQEEEAGVTALFLVMLFFLMSSFYPSHEPVCGISPNQLKLHPCFFSLSASPWIGGGAKTGSCC